MNTQSLLAVFAMFAILLLAVSSPSETQPARVPAADLQQAFFGSTLP